MSCEFCKKIFSSERSLSVHQKSTKSCLLIQERMGYQVTKKSFPCDYCSQEFTARSSLQYHIKKCSKKSPSVIRIIEEKTRHIEGDMEDKLEQLSSDFRNHKEEIEYELKKKDEKIKELEEHIKKNKTPPKITNNIKKNIENNTNIETNIEQQNITIYQIMTPENVESFFKKHYNLDTLLGGQKALARFVNDGFLKESEEPLYLCGDRSRQKFYIVKDGKKVEDPDCNEIIGLTTAGMTHVQDVYETALFSDLPEKVTEDIVQDNYDEIMTIDDQRTDFKSELSKILLSEPMPKATNDIKTTLSALRERSRRLGLLERRKPKEQIEEQPEELIRRPDVLGVAPGKLMVYRDRFRKDGTVKGPASIMKQIEESEEARREYMEYLQS
jgi:hypothetical protein